MGWRFPSTNSGILVRQNVEHTVGIGGAGTHDIIVAEPVFGTGTAEIVRVRNNGGGSYEITIRARGNPHVVVRLHGESVN